uniref:Odorant receptor n=1 Tax=Diabrotica virgifera virgifera TaxID=50390 RepID=A0A6P7FQS7_DIAVI
MTYDSYFLVFARYQMLLIGLWPATISNEFLRVFYKCYSFFVQFYFTFFLMTFTLGMFTVYGSRSEKENSDSMAFLLSYYLSVLKYYLIKREVIRKIMGKVVEFEASTKHDQQLQPIYKKEAKRNFQLGSIVPSFCMSAFLLFFLMNIKVYFIWRKMELQGLESGKILPFPWFPFYYAKYFDYYFFYQVSNAFWGGIYIMSTDALIGSLIMFSASSLKLLGVELGRFGKNDNSSLENINLLRNLILKHQNIIENVEQLNKNFGLIFLLEFTIKSFHISQILFTMLAELKITNETIFDFMKFVIVLAQGVLTYYQANRVIAESEKLGEKIYRCNWTEQPTLVTRSLIIMMIRTTRVLKVECHGVVILSNQLTLKVLQAIYTYLIFRISKS